MRIAKRISFSLDEFLAQWCCRRHAVRRSDVISPGMVNFPGFQQWNALVPEPAKTCQHYFEKIGVQRTTRPTKQARGGVCGYGASQLALSESRMGASRPKEHQDLAFCDAKARHVRNFRG